MTGRSIKIIFLAAALLLIPMQSKAIDPVTIAILAPVALKAAKAASPYLIRSAKNTATCLFKVGKDSLELFYLPYGLGKMIFAGPFGGFRSGLVYTFRGLLAPCKMVVHCLLLPVYMIGVEVNI